MVDYLDFAEERLDLGYDYGAVGGVRFKTEIIETEDKTEQRIPQWYLPLGRWQLGDRTIAESEIDQLEEISYLKQFHSDRRGSKQGFRFKDWSDYQAKGSYIGTGDGVKFRFQLQKEYRVGDAVSCRPIVKPVATTVFIYFDGVLYNNWSSSYSDGVIVFLNPVPEGVVVTADFEFDVPVWFESDELQISLEGYDPTTNEQIYRLKDLFVVEGRMPTEAPASLLPLVDITEELDLGIVYETIEKHRFSTDKLEIASGYVRRDSNRDENQLFFNLGDRVLDREELDRLLNYFWLAKGKARQFLFINLNKIYQVRFDLDRLNIRFEAANDEDAARALEEANGKIMRGKNREGEEFTFGDREIRVMYAEAQEPREGGEDAESEATEEVEEEATEDVEE